MVEVENLVGQELAVVDTLAVVTSQPLHREELVVVHFSPPSVVWHDTEKLVTVASVQVPDVVVVMAVISLLQPATAVMLVVVQLPMLTTRHDT